MVENEEVLEVGVCVSGIEYYIIRVFCFCVYFYKVILGFFFFNGVIKVKFILIILIV